MQRIVQLKNQLCKQMTSIDEKQKPKYDWHSESGWGWKDTKFTMREDRNIVFLSGNRYELCGADLPKLYEWANSVLGLDVSKFNPARKDPIVNPPQINKQLLDELNNAQIENTIDDRLRLMHSHGQTLEEIYQVRHSKLQRVVDLVVYLKFHEEAEIVVKLASKYNVTIIPYGGGSNVTASIMCPQNEQRIIISVDTTKMNKIVSIDKRNMIATIQAGIYGGDMESLLQKEGVMVGHEPDSIEFSTLGGWIATRASGMKKNKYGNIEDIVLQIKIATPMGTYIKQQVAPRMSSGPDLNNLIIGSEGTLGIITEACLKIQNLPELREFNSLIFYDFESGTKFMEELAKTKVWPASIRLVDNTQFVFGMSLKQAPSSKAQEVLDSIKKWFILNIKGFNPDKMCLCTILFEGGKSQVNYQKKVVFDLAEKYKAMVAGPENGQRGYQLTFSIAYLRDFGLDLGFISESFETSLKWEYIPNLVQNAKQFVLQECKKRGVKGTPWISARVTQIYEIGACVYMYFGMLYEGLEDPVETYRQVEDGLRAQMMKDGGVISHHHGVGKLRKNFMVKSIGETGLNILKSLKGQVDPQNIFASGNLY